MLKPTSSVSAGRASSFRRGAEAARPGATLSAVVVLALLSVVAGARRSGGQESPQTPGQKASREVAIAEAASREVQQLRRHSDYREAISRDSEIEAVLDRAQRVLRTAKSGLARAEQTQSTTGFSDSALLARRATRTFEQYEERLREIFAQLEAERAPPPPPPPPTPPPPVEPEPPPAEESEGSAPPPSSTATAAEVVTPPPVAPPPVAPPPRRIPPPPPRSSTPPPVKLIQAAGAYFGGDYAGAVTLLSDSSFRQRKARAHALLLRAAARYALFLLGGEVDYAQRGQAAEDVTACKAVDPDLAPDEGVFSPRFRDFYAAAR